MSIKETLENKLQTAFTPELLKVENISHTHNVPEGSETHFQVTIVSHAFAKMPLVNRHRTVNQLLEELLSRRIHALSMNLYTPEEWKMLGPGRNSPPPCHRG